MQEAVDENLIRASQRGDRSAFERLLSLIYDMIYRFALRWLGRVSDAEDVTQQVCIKLARVIQQFRFESAFSTWLYRLVVNCAKDWQRSQNRHHHEELGSDSLPPESSPDHAIEASSELARVLSLVAAMGDGYREALILVYGEGFSHAEAGEVLGVKESTVSWRLHEIRKRLKALDSQTSQEAAE